MSTMIQGSVLDRTSLEDAVSCDVASKIATTFLSPTEVGAFLAAPLSSSNTLTCFALL